MTINPFYQHTCSYFYKRSTHQQVLRYCLVWENQGQNSPFHSTTIGESTTIVRLQWSSVCRLPVCPRTTSLIWVLKKWCVVVGWTSRGSASYLCYLSAACDNQRVMALSGAWLSGPCFLYIPSRLMLRVGGAWCVMFLIFATSVFLRVCLESYMSGDI